MYPIGMYQHINNYHSMLSAFIMRHKGVSTKYINNYLVWHNFMNYSKECREEKKTIMLAFVLTQYMTIRARNLSARDALPLVA